MPSGVGASTYRYPSDLNYVLGVVVIFDKAKPAERRGRKATGPRFLREAINDSPKDSKIAGLPGNKPVVP